MSAIEKMNSSLFLPNAIQIYTKLGKVVIVDLISIALTLPCHQHFFSGFTKRNEVFATLSEVWVARLRSAGGGELQKEKAWVRASLRVAFVNYALHVCVCVLVQAREIYLVSSVHPSCRKL